MEHPLEAPVQMVGADASAGAYSPLPRRWPTSRPSRPVGVRSELGQSYNSGHMTIPTIPTTPLTMWCAWIWPPGAGSGWSCAHMDNADDEAVIAKALGLTVHPSGARIARTR
jgi:hypothetical protein